MLVVACLGYLATNILLVLAGPTSLYFTDNKNGKRKDEVIRKLLKGSGKDRQGMALKVKGLKA